MSKNKKDHYILKNFGISIVIAIVLMGILFGGAFLSEAIEKHNENQRREHLDDVLSACINSENSNLCIKLKKKYDITFKYCKSHLDSIDKQYHTITLPDGSPYFIYEPIWHGVAWEGDSSMPPNQDNSLISLNAYYDCADHIDTKATK